MRTPKKSPSSSGDRSSKHAYLCADFWTRDNGAMQFWHTPSHSDKSKEYFNAMVRREEITTNIGKLK